MSFRTGIIILIAIPLILSGCCRTTDCIQVTPGDENPVASIKITYKDSSGSYQNIVKSFDGSSSSMNYNIELPHNTDWTAYFKATSSSGLRYFKTQWRKEHNDIRQYYEPWQEEDFTTCPKNCWDRKLEFEDSVHGDVFGLHIYAESFNLKNSGNGNVYVRFSEPAVEPDPDPDPEPACLSSGKLDVNLAFDSSTGLTVTWRGEIPQSALNDYCEGLSITKIKLPRKINCSLITEVCVQEWEITIGDQKYTNFTCQENSSYCELVPAAPIPLDAQYKISAHPPTYFRCPTDSQPCTDNTVWEQYITVTFIVE